jgi:hypothetical protein
MDAGKQLAKIQYGPAVLLGAALMLLQVDDVITTHQVLASGMAREANPIIASYMQMLGPWWPIPKMMLGVGAAVYFATRPRISGVGWAAVVLSVAIVGNNVVNLWRIG